MFNWKEKEKKVENLTPRRNLLNVGILLKVQQRPTHWRAWIEHYQPEMNQTTMMHQKKTSGGLHFLRIHWNEQRRQRFENDIKAKQYTWEEGD